MSEFENILLNGTLYTLGGGSGLTADIKAALLQIAQKVAYIDDDGQTYYDSLENALYPPADLVSISAVYTQSGTVYDTDTLDSLKSDLVVTAHMSDSTTQTVTGYTLSGTLAEGTSTITVSYGGKTATFNVTVTETVLYPIREITDAKPESSITLSVSNGNHVEMTTDANSRICFIYAERVGSNYYNTSIATGDIFTIPAGASYEIKVKNISYSGNTNVENKFTFAVKQRDNSGTTLFSAADIPMPSTGDGTVADVTKSGTLETEITSHMSALSIWVHRAVTLSFDVELRINGVRYI